MSKKHAVYKIKCPACNGCYVGKTDCCFGTRMHEHGTKQEQPVFEHISNCEAFKYITKLYTFPDLVDCMPSNIDPKAHIYESVISNSSILKSNRNWLELCYLESYLIKKYKPKLNQGIKAAKELQLF